MGKTTIIEQLIYGKISPDIHSTIEDIYVAAVDTGGKAEHLHIYDTAGLQVSTQQLPRHFLVFPDAFVFVYDPKDPTSLDILGNIKMDIDRNKEKKEINIIVLANLMSKSRQQLPRQENTLDPESVLMRANNWCARERIKHFVVNAMERASLYEPFIGLAVKLHPTPTKTSFPQLRQLTQKSKSDQ